ncbi:hypothetical protein GWI33_016651, partial [Rhynchophorus ferrugineus]
MFKFGILTVSTTCSEKPQLDTAGPKLEQELLEVFPQSSVNFKEIVTDDKKKIISALQRAVNGRNCDVLFTVGGTGFASSDVTPEATREVIEKEAPGLTHAILSKSLAVTPMAMLSRPICGIKDTTIIMNFPGSAKAAVECFGFVKAAIPHAVALVNEDLQKVRKTHHAVQNPEFVPSKVKILAGAARNRKSQYPMIDVEDAKNIIQEILTATQDFDEVPVEQAMGRVLAEDVKAPQPIPPFPASIKDGYAVRTEDGAGRRVVRSVTAAGDQPQTKELQPQEIVRISTGAAVPAGADAVVQIEDTALIETTEDGSEEKVVDIMVAPKKGQDI